MYTHHKFDHQFDHRGPPSLCYVVCSTPRSGSSLLCELLCNCGLAGAPTEFFDGQQMGEFMQVWGVDGFEAYIGELLRRKTGPNGVFGFKLHHDQLSPQLAALDWDATFPDLRYIYITRRDRIRQAVSFSKAIQSGQWASQHDHNGREPRFDLEELRSCLRNIELQERRWEEHFARHGIEPLRVVYEDLVPRQEATLRESLRFLDLDLPTGARVPPPTLLRQADRHSERWVRRFRKLQDARVLPVWRRALQALGVLGRASVGE
jgi:LPS sulfotransferase NodH